MYYKEKELLGNRMHYTPGFAYYKIDEKLLEEDRLFIKIIKALDELDRIYSHRQQLPDKKGE